MACLQKIIQAIIQMPRRIGWELSSCLGLQTSCHTTLNISNLLLIKAFKYSLLFYLLKQSFYVVDSLNGLWIGVSSYISTITCYSYFDRRNLIHRYNILKWLLSFITHKNNIMLNSHNGSRKYKSLKYASFIELIRFLPTLADRDSDKSKRGFYAEC